MNTNQLKQENHKAYQDFFNKYDLVLSCPIIFNIAGIGFTYGKSYIQRVAQKLPLRNYIGVCAGKNEISFSQFIYKPDVRGAFLQGPMSQFYPLDIETLKASGLSGEVGFFSEYNWLDTPSIVSDIVVSGMLLGGEIDANDLGKLEVHNQGYKPILGKILERDSQLLKSHRFFADRRNDNNNLAFSILGSKSHIYGAGRLDHREIGEGRSFQDADLSSFILNPGIFTKPFFQSDYLFKFSDRVRKISSEMGVPDPRLDFVDAIEGIGECYSIECYKNLRSLYIGDAENNKSFFRDIVLFNRILFGIYKDNADRMLDTDRITKEIHARMPRDVESSTIQMGTRLQVFGTKQLRLDHDMTEQIGRATGHNFTLDYSSHEDGWETEGIKIEQWRSKGVFSEFTSPYSVSVSLGASFRELPSEYEEALAAGKDGIAIDLHAGKILVAGLPVTSKELKTQAATVEILSRLVMSDKKEISSKDLPSSAYSKSRSEMSSKVLSPLRKIVKKRIGVDFPIECGGVGPDFKIRLGECDIPLAVIKKR